MDLLEKEAKRAIVGTGNIVWRSSKTLKKYLDLKKEKGKCPIIEKKVLELGAGLGYLAIECFNHFDPRIYIATDLGEVIPFLQKNILSHCRQENGEREIFVSNVNWNDFNDDSIVKKLDFGVDHGNIELILAADVIFARWMIVPFVRVLNYFSTSKTRVLLSQVMQFYHCFLDWD